MKSEPRDRILKLRSERKSDLQRWSCAESVAKSWGTLRYRLAAKYIPRGASVLDLGCGNQELARQLPPGTAYTPADIVQRTPDTVLIELNSGLWPDGRWDCLCAIGVLEYLFDATDFFARSARLARRTIVTYHSSILPRDETTREARLESGWLSDFTPGELMAAATAAELIPVQISMFGSSEIFWKHLYVFETRPPQRS